MIIWPVLASSGKNSRFGTGFGTGLGVKGLRNIYSSFLSARKL